MLRVGDHFDKLILQRIGILKLIDHHIQKSHLQLQQKRRLLPQHPVGDQQHIVEVDFEIVGLPLLIQQQDRFHFLLGG
ncbi:hypothetical protein D3C87_1734590 [compost metagenome]